jgi:hypothetical protein
MVDFSDGDGPELPCPAARSRLSVVRMETKTLAGFPWTGKGRLLTRINSRSSSRAGELSQTIRKTTPAEPSWSPDVSNASKDTVR